MLWFDTDEEYYAYLNAKNELLRQQQLELENETKRKKRQKRLLRLLIALIVSAICAGSADNFEQVLIIFLVIWISLIILNWYRLYKNS
jgi:hypothetical protein